MADSICTRCPARSRRMATRKYSGNEASSSATNSVITSMQLTSNTRPVTLKVRNRWYSGRTAPGMSGSPPCCSTTSPKPAANTSFSHCEKASTRYAPSKSSARAGNATSAASTAAAATPVTTRCAARSRPSPRLRTNSASAPSSKTSSGRKAMAGKAMRVHGPAAGPRVCSSRCPTLAAKSRTSGAGWSPIQNTSPNSGASVSPSRRVRSVTPAWSGLCGLP
jgi:hypothetical protein